MVRSKQRALEDVFGERLLVLGAHPDDCELMAGGLLVRWPGPKKAVVVTSMKGRNLGKQRVRETEVQRAMVALGMKDYEIGPNPDAQLAHDDALTRYFEGVVRGFRPTVVVTHKDDDFHQDHRAISRAVEATLRRSTAALLHGESYLWSLSSPNLFLDISRELDTKLSALRCYRSIIQNGTFDPKAVEVFHRMRGTQTFRFRYAETFRITKAYADGS